MEETRRKIRIVFGFYTVLFIVLVFSIVNIIMDKETMISTFNPRIENAEMSNTNAE